MKKTILATLLFSAAIGAAKASDLPDPARTPGAINHLVTQDNIRQTICVKGWAKTIRPPVYYTNRLKREQLLSGYAINGDIDPRSYEEDHQLPLSIGGHPTNKANLWPQPRNIEWGAAKKDVLEQVLHERVCSYRNPLPLKVAQNAILTDWRAAYKKYVPPGYKSRYAEAD